MYPQQWYTGEILGLDEGQIKKQSTVQGYQLKNSNSVENRCNCNVFSLAHTSNLFVERTIEIIGAEKVIFKSKWSLTTLNTA